MKFFSQPVLRLVTVNNTIVYTHIDSSLKLQYNDILKDMTYYIYMRWLFRKTIINRQWTYWSCDVNVCCDATNL